MRMAAIGEIRMVREINGPGDDATADEDRLGEHNVGQVRPATSVSVIANEDVSGLIPSTGCSF